MINVDRQLSAGFVNLCTTWPPVGVMVPEAV